MDIIYDEAAKKKSYTVVAAEKHSTEIIFDYDDYVMYIQDDMKNNNQVEYTQRGKAMYFIHEELFLLYIHVVHDTEYFLYEQQHIQNENGNICST